MMTGRHPFILSRAAAGINSQHSSFCLRYAAAMEIPTVSSLSAKEQSTFIEFVDGDSPANYGPYYNLPFASIVEVASSLPPTNERGVLEAPGFKASNWNCWLKGYCDWAVPDEPVDPDAEDSTDSFMMKYMMLSNMSHRYRHGNPQNPTPQTLCGSDTEATGNVYKH